MFEAGDSSLFAVLFENLDMTQLNQIAASTSGRGSYKEASPDSYTYGWRNFYIKDQCKKNKTAEFY